LIDCGSRALNWYSYKELELLEFGILIRGKCLEWCRTVGE